MGLAALYAYESRVPAIAAQKAAGLCDHYKADAKTCRYFTVHETADVHHAEVWKQAITRELERDPASADRALDPDGDRSESAVGRTGWCRTPAHAAPGQLVSSRIDAGSIGPTFSPPVTDKMWGFELFRPRISCWDRMIVDS